MSDTIPPLPELEISDFSQRYTDQHTVDSALRVVYERRPDLFARFAERERANLGVDEYGDEFYRLVSDEVWKHLNKPNSVALAAACFLAEARRRSRLMYGMQLRPQIDFEQLRRKATEPRMKPKNTDH